MKLENYTIQSMECLNGFKFMRTIDGFFSLAVVAEVAD